MIKRLIEVGLGALALGFAYTQVAEVSKLFAAINLALGPAFGGTP